MEKIKIGQIVNVVGLKGELKIYNYSDYKERFEEIEYLYVNDEKYKIQKVRYLKNLPVIKLENIEDRNKAEELKNKNVYIDASQLRELPEGTFYVKDLIGFDVIENDVLIGTLKDIIKNTAQDVYVIHNQEKKEILLPCVSEFILDIDVSKKSIKVSLPNGLLDI